MTAPRTPRWLPWLLGAAAFAAVVLVALHASEERAFLALLEKARPWWLVWALALQAGTYLAQAAIWRVALLASGSHVPFAFVCRLSLAKLFVDQALPSMGMSGAVVVGQALERRGAPRSTVMSAVALDNASYYLGYVVSLAAALALTARAGHATSLFVTVTILFVVICIGLAATVLALSGRVGHGPRTRLQRIPGVGRVVGLLTQADPHLVRNPLLLWRTTALQVAITVLDAATLWTTIRAVGASASPESVFTSFIIASLVRMFGIVPGGLGTFEAASVGTLALSGVPVAVGLSATLLFRGLSFWLPMLPGLALARSVSGHDAGKSGTPATAGR